MPNPLAQAELRGVARRNLDEEWLGILEGDLAGQQVLAAFERTWERVAQAAHRTLRRQMILLTASGRQPALVALVLRRDMQEAQAMADMGLGELASSGDELPLPGEVPEGFPFVNEGRFLRFEVEEKVEGLDPTTHQAAGFDAFTLARVGSVRHTPQADAPDAFLGGTEVFRLTVEMLDLVRAAGGLGADPPPLPGFTLDLQDLDPVTRVRLLRSILRSLEPFEAPFDPLLRVNGAATAEGGSSPMLDAVAAERGVVRAVGEEDEPLRARAVRIQDAVAPLALRDAVNFTADRYGFRVTLREPFDDGTVAGGALLTHLSTTAYVASSTTPAGNQTALLAADGQELQALADMVDPDLAFDGSPPLTPLVAVAGTAYAQDPQSLLLSIREAFAYFLLTTPLQGDPDLLRFFLEEDFLDDPLFGFPDLLDHPDLLARYLAVAAEAQARRAAGVRFDFFLTLPPQFPVP